MESSFVGLVLWTITYSAVVITANVADGNLVISKERHFALFFILAPTMTIHIAVLICIARALRYRRSEWLFPYLIWRVMLSMGIVVVVIMICLTHLTPLAGSRSTGHQDRVFVDFIFPPLIGSVVLGVWSLFVAIRVKTTWDLKLRMRHEDELVKNWAVERLWNVQRPTNAPPPYGSFSTLGYAYGLPPRKFSMPTAWYSQYT